MISPGKSKMGRRVSQALRPASVGAIAGVMALLACSAVLAQGEPVLVKRPAELRDAPGDSARSIASLPVQTQVTRLGERQGPWIKVSTGAAPGTAGWVHMFDVGAPNTTSQGGNAATSALRGITGFFNKGSAQQANMATSTVGIRGLGAEDIANAQPNPAAVGRVEAMRMDAGQARQFAMEASLSPQVIDALPVPAKPRPAPAQNSFSNPGNTP